MTFDQYTIGSWRLKTRDVRPETRDATAPAAEDAFEVAFERVSWALEAVFEAVCCADDAASDIFCDVELCLIDLDDLVICGLRIDLYI